ncbi:MAG: helix-turn-helix transcriptional regulator [Kiritimatiellae bacterium]|nr:helix-turn-helix transcriptional regulator [Kiritimatiellia bacterium]
MTGRLAVPAEWSMRAHSHGFHELVVVVRGAQAVTARGRTLVARPGEMLFYPEGLVHREWAEGGAPMESVYVGFQWRGYRAGMPEYLADAGGRVQTLISWLHAERDAYFAGVRELRHSLLQALVGEYGRLAAQRADPIVDRIHAYVRARLSRRITLDALAREVGMSKYYFIRAYRRLSGRTPMQDVRRIRLETARHLLLTTNLPLKAIAPRVGVADEYYLSRLLRKHLGCGARRVRRLRQRR